MKECSTCSLAKPYEYFYRKPRYEQYLDSAAGRSHDCKSCTLAKRKEYYEKNKQKCDDANTNSRFKKSYGIDLNQYNQLFSNQNGCCAVCEQHQTELSRKLVVDHCHSSQIVRGLLCHSCNTALGLLKEKTKTMHNLINYTNKFSELAAKSNVVFFKTSTKVG